MKPKPILVEMVGALRRKDRYALKYPNGRFEPITPSEAVEWKPKAKRKVVDFNKSQRSVLKG